MMAALRATCASRMLAPAILILSLSVFAGIILLRGRRSDWDGQSYRALRERAKILFSQKKYAEAAELYETGYRRAIAGHDSVSTFKFLNNVGATQFRSLHYGRAIDAFVRARDLALSMEDHDAVSAICANLCSLYNEIGDIDAARAAAEQGLKSAVDLHLAFRSQLLVILGVLASGSGKQSKAIHYFREAVDEAELHATDAQRFEAWSNYAQELFRASRLDEAEAAALNAFRIGHLATVRELRPPLLILARISLARGDRRTAGSLIEQGLAIPPRGSDPQLWNRYFLYERARVHIAERDLLKAEHDLTAALSCARRWREAIASSDSMRSGAEAPLKALYDAYIDTATRINHPAEAFLAVEEERSASLLEMMRDTSQLADDRRWPETYWEDLARLRASEITRLARPAAYDAKAAAIIRERLAEIEAQRGADSISNTTGKDENILSRSTLHDVQQNIGRQEAVLSLHSGNSASFLWAVTRQGLEMHRLPPGNQLAAMSQRFHRAVEESAPERDTLGAKLYATLFGQLSLSVRAKPSWIVTSDDSLFTIPLEALVIEAGAKNRRPVYLVQRHETHRIPSALMLTNAPETPATGPFLAVGDGIYNTADARWSDIGVKMKFAGLAPVGGAPQTKLPLELPRLMSSTYEMQSSAAAWKSASGTVLLTGTNSSRKTFLPALRQSPAIIHIAAHILSPAGSPDQAVIDLGLTAAGTPDVLTSKDIARLHTAGALVVLSGCSSAAGEAIRGTGIVGLSRAWMLAGARAVIGSRWPVKDDTGDLFRSFYAHLASAKEEHRGLGSALQQAQLQMLQSDTWRSDPKYWGAFYLMSKE